MAVHRSAIEAILAERIGLDPGTVGANLILCAVRRRMIELGLTEMDDYVALVTTSETELRSLIEEVVIPESWFFRDEAPFQVLQDQARSGWLARPSRARLRILSIPCAGGEEPYSITIALDEIGLPPDRFQVDAVDISERQLARASQGIYSSNAFRGAGHNSRDRYFQSCGRGFQVDAAIRSRVRFIQGSILDARLLAAEPGYDVVFCRNLLIYLEPPARVLAMATLDRLLATDGLLIIGHADRLNLKGSEPAFTAFGDRRAFTYRRAAALPPARPAPSLTPPPMKPVSRPSSQAAPGRVSPASRPSTPSPVVAAVSSSPTAPAPSPDASEMLEEATRLANLNRHDEAIAACERYLTLRGPNAGAYYLMGMLQQARGDRPLAEKSFSRAVYLDPAHDEALLALALLAERRGDAAGAAGFRRRAERAVQRKEVKRDE